MHWLNIHTSTLDSEEFLSAKPVDQATWLKLQRFCIGQENAGVIHGAKSWTDRQWQQLVRVRRKEVRCKCGLWEWTGNNLNVKFYPIDKEIEVQAKRSAALSTHAKRHTRRVVEQGAERDAEHLERGREEKRKEAEGNDALAPAQDYDPNIPSLKECIQWGQTAGVPEDWIREKHSNTTCTHGWIFNSRVILWKRRWKGWFEEDRANGRWPKKSAPHAVAGVGDVPPPPGRAVVDFDAMRQQL